MCKVTIAPDGFRVLESKGAFKPIATTLHPGDRKHPLLVLEDAWHESYRRGKARIMVVYCGCKMFLSAMTPIKVMRRKYLKELMRAHRAHLRACKCQLFL